MRKENTYNGVKYLLLQAKYASSYGPKFSYNLISANLVKIEGAIRFFTCCLILSIWPTLHNIIVTAWWDTLCSAINLVIMFIPSIS